MLNRIALFFAYFFGVLAVVCIFWINIQGKRIDSLESSKKMLESNTNFLIKRVEREHNDKVELSSKYEKLKQMAKADTDFDWSADISRSDVVMWLRKNAVRVSGSRARAD